MPQVFGFFASILLFWSVISAKEVPENNSFRHVSQQDSIWVEQQLVSMTVEEKVGQLLFIAGYPNKGSEHHLMIANTARRIQPGGIIFFQGTANELTTMQRRLNGATRVPMLYQMDAEWGASMRIGDMPVLPRQMMVGAANDPQLSREYGAALGDQMNHLGIHWNLAPVADVNTNYRNPVIGVRSLGEHPDSVSRHAVEIMKGMQDRGVLTCAKHFPGHGDTEVDSHIGLPVINKTAVQMDSVEWIPFKALIRSGVESVMMAHVSCPEITGTNKPASLSPTMIGLLRNRLGFNGVVITDALNMKGAAAYPPGTLEVEAFLAGNDILLFPQDPHAAFDSLMGAFTDGVIGMERLNASCRRILLMKKKAGLYGSSSKPTSNWTFEDAVWTKRKIGEKGMVLLKNPDAIIPFRELDTLSFSLVTVGGDPTKFHEYVERYAPVEMSLEADRKLTDEDILALDRKLFGSQWVVLNVHGYRYQTDDNFGIPYQTVKLINHLSKNYRLILNVFGSPYSIRQIFGIRYADVIIWGGEPTDTQVDLVTQGLFGGVGFSGRLPVYGSARFGIGDGLDSEGDLRIKYTVPEELGIHSADLRRADELAMEGVHEGAYPGCQVLAMKGNKVFYAKSFGYHDYTKERPAKLTDIYDLASVTKVAATTSSVMKLVDDGTMSIDSTLNAYLPDLVSGTSFKDVNIRHMMAHQAGLYPWIPFYAKTLTNGVPDPTIYSTVPDENHPLRVAENMYISQEYRDVILNTIVNSGLSWRRKYKYSDMGFYLLMEIVERLSGKKLDDYVQDTFYRPMGLSTMTYNPREKFGLERIPPAEEDTVFRHQKVHGDVHDQGAAMLGGVSGHAGLFGNVYHVGTFFHMLGNYGEYAGKQYVSEEVVRNFAPAQFPRNGNRRGAGFDRPVPNRGPGPTCRSVTEESFGHTGFTGITAWTDPGADITFVFLSNRCYPEMTNNKIIHMGVRTRIQQVMYDAVNNADTP